MIYTVELKPNGKHGAWFALTVQARNEAEARIIAMRDIRLYDNERTYKVARVLPKTEETQH
ncbi:hypothetical protein CCP4SC76_390026 [Gammaproteobacteria bacterium]